MLVICIPFDSQVKTALLWKYTERYRWIHFVPADSNPRKYLHSWIANDVVDVLRAFAADESAQGYFETIN